MCAGIATWFPAVLDGRRCHHDGLEHCTLVDPLFKADDGPLNMTLASRMTLPKRLHRFD